MFKHKELCKNNKKTYYVLGIDPRAGWVTYAVAFIIISSSCSDTKVAYLNPVKLSQEYEGVQVKLREFQATTGPWQAQVDTLAAELQRAGAKYRQESVQLTPAQRNAREQELGQRQQQLVQYRDAVMQKATVERQRLDKEVMDEINPYLKEYGDREGYTLILEQRLPDCGKPANVIGSPPVAVAAGWASARRGILVAMAGRSPHND